MSSTFKKLFGGGQQVPTSHLVGLTEGIELEDLPEYELSEASTRLRHMKAAWREAEPAFLGAVAHSDRITALVQQARVYRLMCIVMVIACVVLSVGVVRMAVELTHTRVIPYVVQVDKHGFTVPVGRAERDMLAAPRQVMAALGRWLTSFRTITGEQKLQDGLVQQAFFFVSAKSVAAEKMRETYAKRPVFDGTGRRVFVEISRIAPLPSGTDFSIDWSEEATDAQGENVVKNLYTAVVTVSVSLTEELDHVLVNPSGVFLTDFSISKLQ